MAQRSQPILNAFSATLLGLTSFSFLLIPYRQQSLIANLPLGFLIALGAFFYLGALACALSISISIPARPAQIIRITIIAMLGVLFMLYIRAGLLVESLLPLHAIVLHTVFLVWEFRGKPAPPGILVFFVVVINVLGACILSFRNIPQHQSYGALQGVRAVLIAVFIISAVTAGVSFGKRFKYRWHLPSLAAIPWLIWIHIYVRVPSAPNVIPAVAIVAAIMFAFILPWQRLVLPKGDILGRRAILVGSVGHAITLGLVTSLLFALDLSLRVNNLSRVSLPVRDTAFYFLIAISGLIVYGLLNIILTVNGLAQLNSSTLSTDSSKIDAGLISWRERVARYTRPFSQTHESLQSRLDIQADQISILSRQVKVEKKRNSQLNLLSELSQQLETQLDRPVAGQLAISTLERAIDCDLACLYVHEPERREFVVLASAGRKTSLIPPGYRQNITRGILGRAARQRKTQVINNTSTDPDYFAFENDESRSAVVVPIISNGYLQGLIELNDERENAFSSVDISLAEMVAAELSRGWERSNYFERLTDLIEAGVSLSSMIDPQAAVQEIAAVARQILQARYTFVKIQPGKDETYAHVGFSGYAPRLAASLEAGESENSFVKTAMNALQPFRVRDARKYAGTSNLEIDHSGLRSLLVMPVRLHRLSIGAILAFGKQGEVFFTENDESLASLLSIQAAGAFEGTWLQQELRSSLTTTSLLYQLSNHIIQAEELNEAALYIAQTAQKLVKGSVTGIVLFTPEGKIEAAVQAVETGSHSESNHPMELISQVMKSGEVLYKSADQIRTQICLPIQTHIRKYGVLWLNIPETHGATRSNPADLQTLANQAALALERSRLLVEWRNQAEEIQIAYRELELAYDMTLAALMSSLDARDRETEGHSVRVSQLAILLGKELGLSASQLKALERGSLLHDIGKIGVSDTILHKPGPLDEREWRVMRLHPDIGARIVEGIPFLQETIPVIRYHQERWNGTGYPLGISGKEIPLLARIFAAVDAFDALTSNRPYRGKIAVEDAFGYLREQAGILFDPEIVQTLLQLFSNGHLSRSQLTDD